MVKLNVSIPEDLTDFLSRETARRGLGSPEDYLTQLLKDAQRREVAHRDLEAKLIEGLDSGEPVEANEDFWRECRTVLDRRLTADGES
jgi:antitoxin ParD1/3/4